VRNTIKIVVFIVDNTTTTLPCLPAHSPGGVITDQPIAKGRKIQLTDACYWRGLSGIDRGDYIGGFSSLPHISPPPSKKDTVCDASFEQGK
jgi:hypothetical protein